MATAQTKKIQKMYEGLSIPERVRLFAKLFAEQNDKEAQALRSSTPVEHYEAYNRALAIAQTLNSTAMDWLSLYDTAMERDYMRVLFQTQLAAKVTVSRISLRQAWDMFLFPITKSEYHALQLMEWEEPYSLERYAEHLLEFAETFSDEIAALLEGLDLTESEDYAIAEERVQKAIADAISSGVLPKPKKHEGEPSLPYGVFAAWGEGLKSEKAMKPWPGLHLPALEYLGADLGPKGWDIRPDREKKRVYERQCELIMAFSLLMRPLGRSIPKETIEEMMLHIPTTWEEHKDISEMLAQEFGKETPGYGEGDYAEQIVDTAKVHAQHRAQLESLIEAIEIIQKEDLYGESPLWPESRARIEKAQKDISLFQEAWEAADRIMGWSLKEALGLDHKEMRKEQGIEDPFASIPTPMPTGEKDVEMALSLLRGFSYGAPEPTYPGDPDYPVSE